MAWLQSVIAHLQNEHILYVGLSVKRASDRVLCVPDQEAIMNHFNLKIVNLGK